MLNPDPYLTLALLERLLERLVETLRPFTDGGRWREHRTWLVNGTVASMPVTPDLQRSFDQPDDRGQLPHNDMHQDDNGSLRRSHGLSDAPNTNNRLILE
jgi:hypothetical protein